MENNRQAIHWSDSFKKMSEYPFYHQRRKTLAQNSQKGKFEGTNIVLVDIVLHNEVM